MEVGRPKMGQRGVQRGPPPTYFRGLSRRHHRLRLCLRGEAGGFIDLITDSVFAFVGRSEVGARRAKKVPATLTSSQFASSPSLGGRRSGPAGPTRCSYYQGALIIAEVGARWATKASRPRHELRLHLRRSLDLATSYAFTFAGRGPLGHQGAVARRPGRGPLGHQGAQVGVRWATKARPLDPQVGARRATKA